MKNLPPADSSIDSQHSYKYFRHCTIGEVGVEEAPEFKQRTRDETLSKHFLELLCKTNAAQTATKVTEIGAQQEYQRIIKLLQEKRFDVKGNTEAPFSSDLTVKIMEDRLTHVRSPVSIPSRVQKTPEQAFHSMNTAKKFVNPAPHKKPKKVKARLTESQPVLPRDHYNMKRKSLLIHKTLSKKTMSPLLQSNFASAYAGCYRPIRVVKSTK